jgi:hypothetical protein
MRLPFFTLALTKPFLLKLERKLDRKNDCKKFGSPKNLFHSLHFNLFIFYFLFFLELN